MVSACSWKMARAAAFFLRPNPGFRSSFFSFFNGETLAQQLVRGGGNQAIRDGLATLLHQDKWESAIESVEQVRRKITNEMQNLADASKEYKGKADGLEHVRTTIRNSQAEREEWKSKEVQAETDFNAAEEQIKLLGSGTSHEKLNAELNKKRNEAKSTANELTRLENQICTLIAESKGIPFFKGAFGPTLKILDEMKRQNILPAARSGRLRESFDRLERLTTMRAAKKQDAASNSFPKNDITGDKTVAELIRNARKL